MNGKCPRCGAPISDPPDARGLVHCSGCGVWLRSVSAAEAVVAQPAPVVAAAATTPALVAVQPSPEIQALTAEIRDLRRMQAEILQLQAQILTALRARPSDSATAGRGRAGSEPDVEVVDDEELAPAPAVAPAVPRVRQRRKTALIVDDDPEALQAAVAVLERAQVPVRSAATGLTGIQAIAAEKPDVIVLELDIGEPMPGRDFINMVKATMEWIDVPIVLHTRLPVPSIKEARVQHGADDLVLKGPGSSEALLNRVIAFFQRK